MIFMQALIGGGNLFSVLDLRHAYLQMEVEDESKTILHHGLYQYQRLPYGVTPAPVMWQRVMDQVLQGLTRVFCYLDDNYHGY